MLASTFVTRAPPSVKRGYPPELATAVASIAIITCLAANLLLAHTATITRDKLAEIVMTRKELWRTIAQKESAEAAAVARSDFIASASHEIRTPLHHLQGYSDLLARTPLSDEGRLLLHAIQGATKTLSSITNNVLDWSRIENDSEAPYRPVNFEIRTLCESIVNLLPNKDEEAEVELFIVVKPRVPRTVYLDEAYVYRIFMNLLSNSLKFTKSGYILVIVDVLNEDLVVTVRDTGCGIPPSFMSRLFEPFSQAQTRSMSRGTGLGLSIIKQLLQKMNGNIEVTSQYDKEVAPGKNGSCFVVTMPLDASNLSLAEEPEVGSSLRRVAILKTNEDDRAVEGLNTAWENFGFEAAVVDGVEGLRESTWTYVWADLARLGTDAAERATLFDDPTRTILIPFDTRNDLDGLPNILDLPHVVPLQKPLRWHTFLDRVTAARERSSNRIPTVRTVRFAADAAEEAGKEMPSTKPAPKCFTILVVEDNPVRLPKPFSRLHSSLTRPDQPKAREENAHVSWVWSAIGRGRAGRSGDDAKARSSHRRGPDGSVDASQGRSDGDKRNSSDGGDGCTGAKGTADHCGDCGRRPPRDGHVQGGGDGRFPTEAFEFGEARGGAEFLFGRE